MSLSRLTLTGLATFMDGLDDGGGFRLDHFNEGVSEAHIVWRDTRDGTTDERTTANEQGKQRAQSKAALKAQIASAPATPELPSGG